MFKRLEKELCNIPTADICLYYNTVIKIKETYAKARQLYPADTEAQRLYDDTAKLEKLLQETITERFLQYKEDEFDN